MRVFLQWKKYKKFKPIAKYFFNFHSNFFYFPTKLPISSILPSSPVIDLIMLSIYIMSKAAIIIEINYEVFNWWKIQFQRSKNTLLLHKNAGALLDIKYSAYKTKQLLSQTLVLSNQASAASKTLQ